MYTVSVIIPNYNRADIIGETIENMLSQSLPPHEIIVIDDGSTDHSVQVIRRFGNRVILLQQLNKGPGAARNAGLRIATGEFIQFMDSDDLASLNKLEVQTRALQEARADIVYGPWVRIWKSDHSIRLENVVLQQGSLPASRSPLCWFLDNWSMVFQQCLVKRSLLQHAGEYREDLRSFEDGDLFIRLLLAGGKLIYESGSLTFYRLDDYGKLTASGQQQAGRFADEAIFYAGVISLSEKYPVLRQCTQQRRFIMRVWNVLQHVQYQGSIHPDQIRTLKRSARNIDLIHYIQRWLTRKHAGARQLLKGHRWPGCYKAGPLNEHQVKLINQLEWQLKGN